MSCARICTPITSAGTRDSKTGDGCPPFRTRPISWLIELAHWTQREKENPQSVPWITDSVLPVIEAKRAKIVTSDFAFDDSVELIPTPGHTIDHFSVLVGRSDALVTGDMIHSPLQGKYPKLGMMSDYDYAQAGATRRAIFDRFCDQPTIMCVTHFPSPSTSRVRRWADGYRFISVDG